MKNELKEKINLLKNAIEKEEEIISIDIETFNAINNLKTLPDNKWKIIIPLVIATVGAGAAAFVPDPLEGAEIAALGAGIASLTAFLGGSVGPIIQLAKGGNGIKLLEALRNDYYYPRKSTNDIVYLIRKESISASQLEFPPLVYISNKIKYDEYDEERNIAFLTKKCALEWEQLKSINIRGAINFKDCKNGTIFIKHPFLPKTYIELEASHDSQEIMHEKMVCISNIIQALGAKKLSGKAHFKREEVLNIKNSTDIKYMKVKTSAKIEKNKNEQLNKQFFLNQTWTGAFSEESYNKAKQLVLDFGLESDIDIMTVLQQRDPSNCNANKTFEVTTELTRELNKTLDIAVDFIVNAVELKNDYKSIIKKRDIIDYTLNLEF